MSLEHLKQVSAQEVRRATTRAAAVDLIDRMVAEMVHLGFHVDVSHTVSGRTILLAVDIFPEIADAAIQRQLIETPPQARARAGDVAVEQSAGEMLGSPAGADEPEDFTPPPEEGPETVADAAPPPAAEPMIDADGYFSGPFTAAEVETIIDMSAKGDLPKDIAEYLGRKVGAISNKKRHLKAEIEKRIRARKAGRAEAKASEEPGKTTAEGQGRAAAEEPPASAPLTVTERHVNQRIAGLGYPAPWTPQKDLEFAAAIIAEGRSLAEACARVGASIEDGRARWKAMLPEVTIDGQKALAHVLGWRATHIAAGEILAAE